MLLEELIERTIYHSLRLETVSRGLLPDIYNYDIENNNLAISKSELEKYRSDITKIKNSKGYAIEVFNYANNQAYGDKYVPRIVIQMDSYLPGDIGHTPNGQYVKNEDGTFDITKSVALVSNYYFSVHLIANTTHSVRELHDIMAHVLPRRGYVKRFGDNELRPYSNLLIQFLTSADVSYLSEGIIEKVYRYVVLDVHEIDDITLETNIPPIKHIEIPIKIFNEDSSTIIINK